MGKSNHDDPDVKESIAHRCSAGFARTIVRRPCCVATVTLLVSIILSIAGIVKVTGGNESMFATTAPGDLSDVTSENFDAARLAVEAAGVSEEEDAGIVALPQTQSAGALFIVYEKKAGDMVFTEAALRTIKEINDKVALNPKFSEFCLRSATANETCKAPLSPTNLFYANMTIDGTELDYTVFDTPNFDRISGAFTSNLRKTAPPLLKSVVGAAVPEASAADVSAVVDLNFAIMTNIMPNLNGRGTLQPIDKVINLAQHLLRVPISRGSADFYFPNTFASTGRGKYTRALIQFGRPLAGYKNRDDRPGEQSDKLSDWFQDNFRDFLIEKAEDDPEVDVLYFATPLLGSEFLIIIIVDMSLAVASMMFVFCYLWIQTNSCIIAIAAITEIILSLPLAFFIYRVVFGFEYLAGLTGMCLYIVLAIGADDVFVFMDAYKQALYQGPEVVQSLENRMVWTYKRAAGAMLITSFTTMSAFLASAASPLAEIASFGIFSALAILADYLLVITWMPAIVVMYHNKWETKVCCCCCCMGSHGAGANCKKLCKKQEVTTTEARLKALTDAPIAVSVTRRLASNEEEMQADPEKGVEMVATGAGAGADAGTGEPAAVRSSSEPVKKRWIEHFFEGAFADFIITKKMFILIGFGLLLIPIIILAASATSSSTPDQIFPRDHPFQRIFDILDSQFGVSTENRPAVMTYMWGVKGMDREGVNVLVKESFVGKVVFNTNFEFNDQTQQFLLDFCTTARTKNFLSRDLDVPSEGRITCVMEVLREYRIAKGLPFPIPLADVHTGVDEFLQANVNGSDFKTNFGEYGHLIGLVDGRLSFVAAELFSQLNERGFEPNTRLQAEYKIYDDFAAEINANAPMSVGPCFQTTDKWVWMRTQQIFIRSAITGATLGGALAFCVLLLATQNIVVAFLATLTIAGILSTVLALMVALGWELGTLESISLTILAGFAVDYVVHLSHSYMHSTKTKRAERVRDSLRDMGVSVLSGMITSVGAAFVLFFTTLQYFAKFGGFLCMTTSCSWIWANLFFMSMMAYFGPEGGEVWLGLCRPRKADK